MELADRLIVKDRTGAITIDVAPNALLAAGGFQEPRVERPIPHPGQAGRSKRLIERAAMGLFRFCQRAIDVEYQCLKRHVGA